MKTAKCRGLCVLAVVWILSGWTLGVLEKSAGILGDSPNLSVPSLAFAGDPDQVTDGPGGGGDPDGDPPPDDPPPTDSNKNSVVHTIVQTLATIAAFFF